LAELVGFPGGLVAGVPLYEEGPGHRAIKAEIDEQGGSSGGCLFAAALACNGWLTFAEPKLSTCRTWRSAKVFGSPALKIVSLIRLRLRICALLLAIENLHFVDELKERRRHLP
jgi:hypothetical protein